MATARRPWWHLHWLVTASASGSAITIQFATVGTAGNASVGCSSATSQGTYFSGPSFTCPASTALSGGYNPEGASLDFNYFVTQYNYDALGNLLKVTQQGDPTVTSSSQWRVRTFTYDSLSRLLTATNPESGTISYSYDADSNMLQKTSPAPNQTGTATQTVSYCYDALNRVTGKAYSAQACPLSSPVVTYSYDAGANGIGHLTSLTDQAGSGSYSYDALGRMAGESRTIAGIQKSLAYTYNLDGSVATLSYPSGAVVTYTPDSADRMLSAVDNGNNITYVTGATYGPDSGLTGFVSGHSSSFAGITNSFTYNNRLQPINMSASSPSATVFSIGYDFHIGNGDNGNIYGITNYRDATRNQAFAYDALNRLTSAQNAGTDCTRTTVNGKTEYWGNSYGYDAWGNLLQKTITKCGAENLSVSALANNQLVGYSYDAAGNMTHDVTTGLNYSFDSENRITGAAGYTYTYDADGNRVEKSNGTTGTIYWYMSPGIVAESDLSGNLKSEYVFFGGRRTARKDFPGGAVSYYFADHLGTASVITNSAGNITAESDYYPFGGELQLLSNDSNKYKYGGHERDAETGLDYFGARYYANPLSRFLTPDWAAKPVTVPYAQFGSPQSLNLYTYGRNNPTTLVDPFGHDVKVDDDKALERIRSTVPKDVQAKVFLDKKGMVDKSILNLKSNDPNVKALQALVKNNGTLEVKTATGAVMGKYGLIEFKYQSAESVAAEINSGRGPDQPKVDPKNIEATNFTGVTSDPKNTPPGTAIVTLSDGTGKAASAPPVEFAVTTAHEMYGHALPQLQGQPWEHDRGPVDANIMKIEQHTRELYEHDHP